MAFFKKGKHYADWVDVTGHRRRKAFVKKGDAVRHEKAQRALRSLNRHAEKYAAQLHPKKRAGAEKILAAIGAAVRTA